MFSVTATVNPTLQGLQERLARLRAERGVVAGEFGVGHT
jgi:predicted chitinase